MWTTTRRLRMSLEVEMTQLQRRISVLRMTQKKRVAAEVSTAGRNRHRQRSFSVSIAAPPAKKVLKLATRCQPHHSTTQRPSRPQPTYPHLRCRLLPMRPLPYDLNCPRLSVELPTHRLRSHAPHRDLKVVVQTQNIFTSLTFRHTTKQSPHYL